MVNVLSNVSPKVSLHGSVGAVTRGSVGFLLLAGVVLPILGRVVPLPVLHVWH